MKKEWSGENGRGEVWGKEGGADISYKHQHTHPHLKYFCLFLCMHSTISQKGQSLLMHRLLSKERDKEMCSLRHDQTAHPSFPFPPLHQHPIYTDTDSLTPQPHPSGPGQFCRRYTPTSHLHWCRFTDTPHPTPPQSVLPGHFCRRCGHRPAESAGRGSVLRELQTARCGEAHQSQPCAVAAHARTVGGGQTWGWKPVPSTWA